MYLNETEEILAIIVCFAIVVGFVVKTIQDVKTTVAEEKAKFNQQKEDEAKVRQLIDFWINEPNYSKTFKNFKIFKKNQTMKTLQADSSLQDLLTELDQRLTQGQYNDSVHKIKLLTTQETIQRLLNE